MPLCKEHILLYHKLFSFYVTVETFFLSNWLEVGYMREHFIFCWQKEISKYLLHKVALGMKKLRTTGLEA